MYLRYFISRKFFLSRTMSRYRITVEWGIGVIKQKWKLLKTKVNFFPEIGSHVFVTSIAKCMYRLSMYPKQLDAFAP